MLSMKTFDFLWHTLNWLELVVYIIIPSSIILMILLYIYFNFELIKISFSFDTSLYDKFSKAYKNKKLKDIDNEELNKLDKLKDLFKDKI